MAINMPPLVAYNLKSQQTVTIHTLFAQMRGDEASSSRSCLVPHYKFSTGFCCCASGARRARVHKSGAAG